MRHLYYLIDCGKSGEKRAYYCHGCMEVFHTDFTAPPDTVICPLCGRIFHKNKDGKYVL